MFRMLSCALPTSSLNWRTRHFDEIFVWGSAGLFKWQLPVLSVIKKNSQYDDVSVLVRERLISDLPFYHINICCTSRYFCLKLVSASESCPWILYINKSSADIILTLHTYHHSHDRAFFNYSRHDDVMPGKVFRITGAHDGNPMAKGFPSQRVEWWRTLVFYLLLDYISCYTNSVVADDLKRNDAQVTSQW